MPFCGFASLLGSSWVECHPSAIRQPKDPALTLVCLSSFLTKDPVCIVQATLTLHCKDIVASGRRKTASDSQRHVASRILSSTFNNLQPLPTTLIHIHPLSSTFTHFHTLQPTFNHTFLGHFLGNLFLWPLSIIFDILEVPAFQKYITLWVLFGIFGCSWLCLGRFGWDGWDGNLWMALRCW